MSKLKQLEVIEKERERLKEIERVIKRDRKDIEILKLKYAKGLKENSKIEKELKIIILALEDRESKLIKKETDADNYRQDLENREKKVEGKVDKLKVETSNFQKQLDKYKDKEKQLDGKMNEVKRKEQEANLLIEEHTKKAMAVKDKETTLKDFKYSLDKRETLVIEAEKKVKAHEQRAALESRDLDSKQVYVDKTLKKIEADIKEYFSLKKSVENSLREADKKIETVGKREEDIKKKENKLIEDKQKLIGEAQNLSKWRSELTDFSLSIKDRERLVSIDERKVREQVRIVREIRNDINKNEGGN